MGIDLNFTLARRVKVSWKLCSESGGQLHSSRPVYLSCGVGTNGNDSEATAGWVLGRVKLSGRPGHE